MKVPLLFDMFHLWQLQPRRGAPSGRGCMAITDWQLAPRLFQPPSLDGRLQVFSGD